MIGTANIKKNLNYNCYKKKRHSGSFSADSMKWQYSNNLNEFFSCKVQSIKFEKNTLFEI